MKSPRRLIAFGIVFAATGFAERARAAARQEPDVPAVAEKLPRSPVFGVGYHPGNFVGPVAFDIILRPLAHLAFDVQVGYWTPDDDVHSLGVAPQVQWEFLRGWQTPYAGLLFRHEEVWSEGVKGASEGGAVTGGWQFRWQSGLGILAGAGVLYKTAITVRSPRTTYASSGGVSGTYEVGIRYFF